MSCIFSTYKLSYTKEKSGKYEVDRKISGPASVYKVCTEVIGMQDQAEETLIVMALNTKNAVIGIIEVSRGSLNSSIVHPREVFKGAMLLNAASIIIAHNHPSGDPAPSNEDLNITKRLYECGKILGVELLDHLIIGDDSYISLKEKGTL